MGRIVPYDEVRLALELDRARSHAVIPRHAQSRGHAQQHTRAIGERHRESLSGCGDVLTGRHGRRASLPRRPPRDHEHQCHGDAQDPGRRHPHAAPHGQGTRARHPQESGCPGPRGKPAGPLGRVTAAHPKQPVSGPREVPGPRWVAGEAPQRPDLIEQLTPGRIRRDPCLDRRGLFGRTLTLDESQQVGVFDHDSRLYWREPVRDERV